MIATLAPPKELLLSYFAIPTISKLLAGALPATTILCPSFRPLRSAVASSIATSPGRVGRRPFTALKDSKRSARREATNEGACPPASRLPLGVRNVAVSKMPPEASATPATDRTFASIASSSTEVCGPDSLPRRCFSVTTTDVPLKAVPKMPAKELFIVSVRM